MSRGRGAGRRPLPTALKKLRGNAGKRKLNDEEPNAPPGEPPMPGGLPAAAKREWKAIVPELQILGVLSKVDRAALAAYCHCYARWFEAEKKVRQYGLIVEEPVLSAGEDTGYVRLKANPAIRVSNDAAKQMKSFLVEFGMTPSSRSRIRVEKPAAEREDKFEKFLKSTAMSSKHVQ